VATLKENLETVRDQIVDQLLDMTLNPKPDYGGPGRSVSWGAHHQNLMNALEELETRIQRAGGPISIVSRAKA
jgi:hypothetical protein